MESVYQKNSEKNEDFEQRTRRNIKASYLEKVDEQRWIILNLTRSAFYARVLTRLNTENEHATIIVAALTSYASSLYYKYI